MFTSDRVARWGRRDAEGLDLDARKGNAMSATIGHSNRHAADTHETHVEPSSRPGMLQVVGEDLTRELVTMTDALSACEAVLRDLDSGAAELSRPSAMFLEGDRGVPTMFKVKGGVVPSLDVCGFRVVGDAGEDGRIGEHHYCYLLDRRTAVPVALVAQTHIHRMRTAASGLLAARLFSSRPDPVVALIGAGRIGRCLVEGFRDAFPLGRLVVASRRAASAQEVIASIADEGIVAVPSVADAIGMADTVVTLSSATAPLFDASAFRPGMTVVGMGENHELSASLLHAADRFVVDDLDFATTLGSAAAWVREGLIERAVLKDRLHATLGATVSGRVAGRGSVDERILVIVQGLAIADLALAEICRRRALARAVGGFSPL